MGKRSNFKRRPQDAYDTPWKAVRPLYHFLPEPVWFWEPCAGKGDLIRALESDGHYCTGALDIKPRFEGVDEGDALRSFPCATSNRIITNPPWTREILHPMIDRFSGMLPTWLLFDADWMHNAHATPYLEYCRKIVSVGRVKWIPDSKFAGKDNCAWYLFDKFGEGETEFVGRFI